MNFPRVKAKTLLILPPAAGENLSKKKSCGTIGMDVVVGPRKNQKILKHEGFIEISSAIGTRLYFATTKSSSHLGKALPTKTIIESRMVGNCLPGFAAMHCRKNIQKKNMSRLLSLLGKHEKAWRNFGGRLLVV